MKIKVRGGTLEGSDNSLCFSCREATVIQGSSHRELNIFCSAVPYGATSRVTFPVKQCSAYDYKANPRLGDLYEAAWILRTDAKSKHIGFVPYKDLSEKEKEALR